MGYRLHLFFLWIPQPELALGRIRERVRSGGHSVPEAVVRRRFSRGLQNFFRLYAPIMDAWLILDSSGREPEMVAFWVSGQEFIFRREIYDRIAREAEHR